MRKGKIKLIFFDMEGVIFESGVIENRKNTAASVWSVIPKLLGNKCLNEEDIGKVKWNKGEFTNYIEWCEYTINLYKKYGLTMKQFYGAINKIPFMKGAKETFQELRKKGYKTCVISGGIKNLANRAIRELDIDHSFISTEFFFDDDGKLTSWNILPSDYEGKVDFMKLMMREYKLNPDECAFVGDGVNDIPLAKETGMSIAFNGRKELEEVTTYSVNQEEKDLRGILNYF